MAMLLAGTAAPVIASSTGSTVAEADTQATQNDQNQDIVVNGYALFPDIQPERNLDEGAIESYGVDTVDELLGEVEAELGDDQDPLILVNGQRVNDLGEIGAYPIEVLKNAQVLPRGSAVRLGGTSGQRVISLTLAKQARSATLTAAPKIATEGHWDAIRGEGILTRIRGSTRANIAFRLRNESSLLESERSIVQPDPFRPYAESGNVIAYPSLSGEIDPLLTDAAGEVVTVAPVPANSAPTLADFAAHANDPALTDLGNFRTLRPSYRNYDINANFSTRLAPWLTASATGHLAWTKSNALRSLPNALFVLQDSNPASPFSRDVVLAFYGPDPLHSTSKRDGGDANLTLDAQWGRWTADFNASYSDWTDRSTNQRQAAFGLTFLDDGVDPFTAAIGSLIPLRTDLSSAHAYNTLGQLTLTGPTITLPAGPVVATAEGRLSWNSLHSASTFSNFGNGNFRRDEQAIRTSLDIPLTSRSSPALPQLGDITASAEYGHVHLSDAGGLDHYALGLTWEPIPALRLRGSIEETESPPSIQVLGNPVIVTPDVRIFDSLTGTTVDVTQITGGNPDLLPQKLKLWRLTGLVRLVPRLNLQLNGEYSDSNTRNFVSSLPDSSSAIMLAFPDRFIRNADGVLTTVDLRQVNFDSDHERRLRWGLSMNAKIAGGIRPATAPGQARRSPPVPPTLLQLTVNHTIVFSDRIVIRSRLDPVDLLGGGAIGIGGGRLRHQLDGTAAVTSGGTGVRIGVTWRGPSSLDARIGSTTDTLHFSPVFLVNLRAFADLHRLLPQSQVTKGTRLSFEILNLFNDRQSVRDSSGNTPLQYQPAYRDPVGRTIEFEIRKVF